MATRIEPFVVTTPASTAIASFQRTSLPFQKGRVDRVEIIIPPGPSGLVGFKLAHSGQAVIPIQADIWNVADDTRFDWPLTNFPDGLAWELWTYNTDVYDHSIYLWFHVVELSLVDAVSAVPLSIAPGGDSLEAESGSNV